MKTVVINHPTDELKDLLAASREDRVLVKRGGKPVALVIDVREKDEEQIRLENDPEFWRMIEERRKSPTISWEEAMVRLGLSSRRKNRRAIAKKTKRGVRRHA